MSALRSKCSRISTSLVPLLLFVLALSTGLAVAQTWTQLATTGGPPQPPGGSAVHDPNSNRAIIYGVCCAHTTEVWALANADGLGGTPAWVNIVPAGASGAPPGRHAHATAYDSINNRMIIFSGCGGGCFPVLTDVWVLANADGFDASGNPAAASWSQLFPTPDPSFGSPAGRANPVAVYDGSTNQMILFGGQNGGGFGGATFPEVWRLTHANGLGGTPAWIRVTTAGPFPPGQYISAAAYDAANNRLIVFGGAAQGTGASTNAVFALSNANGTGAGTPTWTNVVPEGAAGSPPAGGWRDLATYDPVNSRLLLVDFFSGGAVITSNTLSWVLQHANGLGGPAAWQQLVTTGAPTNNRPLVTPVYNSATNRLTAFRSTVSGVGAEAWVLTNANGITNQPPVADAGANQTVECASHTGTSVTLDGSASSDPDGDTLTFQWTDANNNVLGSTATVNVTAPLGVNTYTLKVTDPGGLFSTATTNVTVEDTTPPVLALSTSNIVVTLPTASATGATVDLAGIASASDTCDPSPTIANNAPALFPIGSTTVTLTATDHSGNSSQQQLTVQVVYDFTGYFMPLLNNGQAVFKAGRTIPVKFQLTAADGTIVSNATATLQVAMVSGAITGTIDFTDATASGDSNTGNLFRFDADSGQYIYNLSTQGYSVGTYLIRTTLNDGTTHDVQFSLK